jgi:hypothetical protein
MNLHWREVLHALQAILTFIGGGAVLGFIAWAFKRGREKLEDSVLLMFQNDPDQRWRTAEGIHGDYIKGCLKDVPMRVTLLAANVNTRWTRLKWQLRILPYLVRHVWRGNFFFVPGRRKVERTVLHLWKRGLLVRNEAAPRRYRLKQI